MARLRFAAVVVMVIAANSAPLPLMAQDPGTGTSVSPVLTIDQDRLYTESLWGKRALADLEARSTGLQAENRKIEAALTAEEKTLTERRPIMAAEEFRKLADDFDRRVTGIRQAQDTKARDLTRYRDEDRQAFYDAALPVMGEVMDARGAVAILDKRAIFLSATAIDVTDTVRALIDRKLGAGPTAATP